MDCSSGLAAVPGAWAPPSEHLFEYMGCLVLSEGRGFSLCFEYYSNLNYNYIL